MSFRDTVLNTSIKPHASLVAAIADGTHPLGDNRVFQSQGEFLASEEYKRCVELFEKRMGEKLPQNNFSMNSPGYNAAMAIYFDTQNRIEMIELVNKKKLVTAAENAIRRMYDIPDHVDLQGFLEKPSPDEFNAQSQQSEDEAHIEEAEPISEDRKTLIEREAQKRVIMNSFSHGSSVHIWKSAYYICKAEINEIHPDLVELYDDYSAIVSLILWMYPADFMQGAIAGGTQINQGFNRVEFDSDDEEEEEDAFDPEMEEEYKKYLEEQGLDEEPDEDNTTGIAVGINFPVLLHEMNKVAFEILLMNSIPVGFNEQELNYYYAIADNYYHEIWHYYLGPKLWSSLLAVINETDHPISETLFMFSKLSYKELSDFCILCVEDKEKGVEKLNLMFEFFENS